MDISALIILAVLQGIAEFFPISSSGHFVIVQHLLGIEEPKLFLNITLHVGTLVAICIYFRAYLIELLCAVIPRKGNTISLKKESVKMILFLVLGTIPAVILALSLKDMIVNTFSSVLVIGVLLVINGCILFFASRKKDCVKDVKAFSGMDALLIGIAQGVALLPGISRSGMTMSAGLARGFKQELAFRFSFLLAIPAIIGATIFDLKELGSIGSHELILYCIGGTISGIIGFYFLSFLRRMVIHNKLYLFSYYCWVVGISIIVLKMF
jgi:undecaprenyl-diphosphatase